MTKGLLAVFTGDGKGKTTAALGLSLRALGHGQKVCFIQFLKGAWKSGEAKFSASFPELLDFHVLGRGFTWKSDDLDRDRQVARDAWTFAVSKINEKIYDLIVLDELTYLIHYNMIPKEEILDILARKPATLHLIITGRYAPDILTQMADLVTEMKAVKHPYTSGIKAQKGFDY
jgi:cob(I)alamin adenosyltransferase